MRKFFVFWGVAAFLYGAGCGDDTTETENPDGGAPPDAALTDSATDHDADTQPDGSVNPVPFTCGTILSHLPKTWQTWQPATRRRSSMPSLNAAAKTCNAATGWPLGAA